MGTEVELQGGKFILLEIACHSKERTTALTLPRIPFGLGNITKVKLVTLAGGHREAGRADHLLILCLEELQLRDRGPLIKAGVVTADSALFLLFRLI